MDRIGRCVNFGNCTTANQKQTITMPAGLELKCPECSRSLVEVTQTAKSSAGVAAVFGAALVLLGAAGWFLWNNLRGGSTGSTKPDTETTSTTNPTGTFKAMLSLHGSNTIGEQLAPALAEAFFKAQGAQDVKVVRDSPEVIRVVGDGKTIAIEARGTSTGFKDLGKSCDIAMASRPVKSEESSTSTGDLTLPSAEHVVGLDGVAIIVNRNNPVDTITREQLSKIFAGITADWGGVDGGKSGPVTIYARDAKSGTFETIKSLVLGARDLATGAQRFEDSAQLAQKVAADPSGIGFVGLPYVGSTKVLAVSDKGSRALTPNRLTVATEDYVLSRRLFFYNSANVTPADVNRFVEFALSKAGQDIVEKIGFVSQHVRTEKAPTASAGPAADSPAEYKKIAATAERLSLDYRFKAGSVTLDNKAVVDLDRLITFLGDLHYSGADLLLLGFADSTGDPASNQKLSKERATAVADQIERRGIKPGAVVGFGQAMPVADNGAEDGRQKNRRVEVWVKKK